MESVYDIARRNFEEKQFELFCHNDKITPKEWSNICQQGNINEARILQDLKAYMLHEYYQYIIDNNKEWYEKNKGKCIYLVECNTIEDIKFFESEEEALETACECVIRPPYVFTSTIGIERKFKSILTKSEPYNSLSSEVHKKKPLVVYSQEKLINGDLHDNVFLSTIERNFAIYNEAKTEYYNQQIKLFGHKDIIPSKEWRNVCKIGDLDGIDELQRLKVCLLNTYYQWKIKLYPDWYKTNKGKYISLNDMDNIEEIKIFDTYDEAFDNGVNTLVLPPRIFIEHIGFEGKPNNILYLTN